MGTEMRLLASDDESLRALTHAVHDWWIPVDEIEFVEADRLVRIPISDEATSPADASTHVVLVHHASQPGIQDEALIGGGDINTIRFSDGLVEIECAFPLLIRIPVTALEIEVRAV
jgi:hypothetical protein